MEDSTYTVSQLVFGIAILAGGIFLVYKGYEKQKKNGIKISSVAMYIIGGLLILAQISQVLGWFIKK